MRVVRVGMGWNDAPLSRLTRAVPAAPASTSEPSGRRSLPSSEALDALSTACQLFPLSVERRMWPRMPNATIAPSAAACAPKKEPW